MAEKVFVVKIDTGDHGDPRGDDVGGIETSAKAGFEDRELHSGLRKMQKGYRGDALEKRGMSAERAVGQQFFDFLVNERKVCRKLGVGNLFAVHANALVDTFQMRRSVKAGAITRMAEDRLQECSSGPFAVGPRDMNGWIFFLRIAKRIRKDGDVFQVEFCRGGLGGRSQLPPKR